MAQHTIKNGTVVHDKGDTIEAEENATAEGTVVASTSSSSLPADNQPHAKPNTKESKDEITHLPLNERPVDVEAANSELIPPEKRWQKIVGTVLKVLIPVKHWMVGYDPSTATTSSSGLERNKKAQKESVITKDPFLDNFILQADKQHEDLAEMTLFSKLNRQWQKMVVDPSKSFYYYWISVVGIAVLYNLVIILARYAFDDLQDEFLGLWLTLDYLSDAIYVVDTIVQSRKAFLEQGLLVVDGKRLRWRYIKSKDFVLDVLSLLPTDLLYFAFSLHQTLLRLNRILRLRRLIEFADRMETRTSWPNFFRLLKLIIIILVLFHWNACFYFCLSSKVAGIGSEKWCFGYQKIENPTVKGYVAGPLMDAADERHLLGNLSLAAEGYFDGKNASATTTAEPDIEIVFSNLTREYLFSFYWSALTLMTIGEQEEPVRNWEFVFHFIDILLGLLIFATIVGNVGEMITNLNQAEAEFQERLDGVKMYMKYRKVKADLQSRVINWFHYIWSQKQSLDEDAVTANLPTKLKAELAIQVHMETLKQVRIFQDCEAGLLVELVLKLKLQVFSPGDYICRKGDVGKEMYIVKRGCLNVVSEDGTIVFVTLKEGSVFGELSVLNIPGNKTGNKRTASVRSVGYSDLFVLSKDDLWEALREYPDAKTLLLQKGREILMKDGLVDTSVTTAADDTKNESIDQKYDRIERQLKGLEQALNEHYAEFNEDTMLMKQRVTQCEKVFNRNKKLIKKDLMGQANYDRLKLKAARRAAREQAAAKL